MDNLLEKLRSSRFIAVVGSSGCGKSSLVRAGLIPTLKDGFLLGHGDRWRFATMRPRDSPMANLAASMLYAFDAGLQVIPVMVGFRRRDPMPRREDLPDSIGRLAGLNYAEVFSGQDFKGRVDDLIKQIEQTVGPVGALARLLNWLSAQS